MPCLTEGLREELIDYNHPFIILSLQAWSATQCAVTGGGGVGFGCVSDTRAVNLCNKETDLTCSSSSSGMTLLRSHSVSVDLQLYIYINTTACLPEAVSAGI